jgi:hypothetical protein
MRQLSTFSEPSQDPGVYNYGHRRIVNIMERVLFKVYALKKQFKRKCFTISSYSKSEFRFSTIYENFIGSIFQPYEMAYYGISEP